MFRVSLILAMFVLYFPAAYAQRGTGEVTGIVRDPSGAVSSGTLVKAVEVNSSSARTTLTNSDGSYSFPDLQPGEYEISVEAAEFARFVTYVQVMVGSHLSIDPHLSINPIRSSITVVGAGGVHVETQTPMLSQVINGLQLTELPTLTRDPYDLVNLASHISPGDPAELGAGVAINGQRAASTSITLDGAENTNSYEAEIGLAVPLDSVEELRIGLSTFTAEYGRASGGMVDVETRSGTNEFHGSLYEFNRISAFAANTYDNNAHGIPRPEFTRNQFGYALGGPILRNRLFFFQSMEWTRVRSEQMLHALAVTPRFIAVSAPATVAYFNKFAGNLNPINGAIYTKADLIANQIIPTPGGPFDALPLDTPVLGDAFYTGFADAGAGFPQNSYNGVARLDLNASQHTQILGRFALEKRSLSPGFNFSSPYPGYNEPERTLNKNALVGLTHAFSNTLVIQSRVSFDRLDKQDPLGTAPPGPALTFPGAANLSGVGIILPGYPVGPQGLTQYEWQFDQSVTWSHGNHQFRLGGQYFHFRNNAAGLNGTLATQNLAPQVPKSFDQFLLGQVHSFSVAIDPQGKFPCYKTTDGEPIQTPDCTLNLPLQSPGSVLTFNRDGSLYGDDTWRISRNLTLSLGLRWEYYGVQSTTDEALASNFYLGSGSNFAEQIRNGQVLTVPDSPIHNIWSPNYKDFGPRLGFAWNLFGDGSSSLRGGFGISYENNYGRVYRNLALNPPGYSVATLLAGTALYPAISIATDNLGPLNASSGTLPFPDSPAFQVNAHIKTASADNWSLSFEHQLLPGAVAALAYSGSRGVNLYSRSLTDLPGAGVIYGGDDPNVNPLGTLSRQYEEVYTRGNGASSIHNALSASLRGYAVRNSGLSFSVNYTFAHTIDDTSSTLNYFPNDFNFGFLDPRNPNLDRGDAEFDIRHNFAGSIVWQSPWFHKAPNLLQRFALGGWTLSSIIRAMTGTPFTVYDCTFANQQCPRYIPSASVSSSGHAVPTAEPNFFEYIPLAPAVPYKNPRIGISDFGNCALVPQPPCPFPSAMSGRDFFRGPGTWAVDVGMFKNFSFSDKWILQLRAELFNSFNHPNLVANSGDAEISANPEFVSASKSGNRNVQLAIKLSF